LSRGIRTQLRNPQRLIHAPLWARQKYGTFIENIVLIKRQKSLSLKVTLTIDLTMSLVGALAFSSLVTMILIQNFTAMMTRFIQVVMGVALVGRMVPSSILLDIALIE